MTYPDLVFPTRTDRPFFYSNFVQTLDGKTQVLRNTEQYWPLGSSTDYETLVELRAYADVLIHGKNTALHVRAVGSLGKESFQTLRSRLGKGREILYAVCSAHPTEELRRQLINPPQSVRVVLFSTEDSVLLDGVEQVACGATGKVDPTQVCAWLYDNGYATVLNEGGPHLFGSFLEARLVDELFVTITPKIVGNVPGATLTMVESGLFPAKEVPPFHLLSALPLNHEVYLRYQLVS